MTTAGRNDRWALLDQVDTAVRSYLSGQRDDPVPGIDPSRVRSALGEVDLDEPIGPSEAIARLAEAGRLGASRQSAGRYFGFVNGGLHPVAHAAAVLAAAWDQNVALPVMSPVAAAADEVAVEWVRALLGLPGGAEGAFCAGASVANLTAILTARDELLRGGGWDVAADGLFGAPAVRVLATEEIHVSARRAVRLAGLGEARIETVVTDDLGRLDPSRLPALDDRPTLVIAQAGNVNTGHSDPFDLLADFCGGAPNAWLHVDGAFGAWLAASDRRTDRVAGMARADSLAVDTHKWLNTPYDGALTFVVRSGALRRTMQATAAYLVSGDETRELMHLGIQMSQAARGIPVWATVATLGRKGVAESIDRCCDLAERWERRLARCGSACPTPRPRSTTSTGPQPQCWRRGRRQAHHDLEPQAAARQRGEMFRPRS